jgi:hypothetical protein
VIRSDRRVQILLRLFHEMSLKSFHSCIWPFDYFFTNLATWYLMDGGFTNMSYKFIWRVSSAIRLTEIEVGANAALMMPGFISLLTFRSSRHLCSANLVFIDTCDSVPLGSLKADMYASKRSEHGAGLYALLNFVIRRSRRVTLVAWLRRPPMILSEQSSMLQLDFGLFFPEVLVCCLFWFLFFWSSELL